MPELRVAVRMIVAFLGLAIALQAIILFVKELGHFDITDRMVLLSQLRRERPRALTDPSQRRLRITARATVNQALQCMQQTLIGFRDRLAPRSRTPDAPFRKACPRLKFADSLGNRFPGQSTRTAHERHAAIAQSDRFARRHETPCSFVKKWPNRSELLREHRQMTHSGAS